MAVLKFKEITFKESEDKNKIQVDFLKVFYAEIDKKELEKIGKFKINKNKIEFIDTSDAKANKKFNFLLEKAFKNLTNKVTKKPVIYVHQNSGIPLIGNNAFGLIDRNTSIIEVRVMTGCNLECIYCSVDQDQRPTDFVVEKDYLVDEFRKLVERKKIDQIEAHIGTQGEPLLYEPLADLIKDLSAMKQVSTIALDRSRTGANIIDTSNLLAKEKEFYDYLVGLLDRFRKGILFKLLEAEDPYVEGGNPVSSSSAPSNVVLDQEDKSQETPELNNIEPEINPEVEQEVAQVLEEENTTKKVKFKESVPVFMGEDLKEYGPYEVGATAELPLIIADLLITNGKVEEIQGSDESDQEKPTIETKEL